MYITRCTVRFVVGVGVVWCRVSVSFLSRRGEGGREGEEGRLIGKGGAINTNTY